MYLCNKIIFHSSKRFLYYVIYKFLFNKKENLKNKLCNHKNKLNIIKYNYKLQIKNLCYIEKCLTFFLLKKIYTALS